VRMSICIHCGRVIGLWKDPWGGHVAWMHCPEDGPDAYEICEDGESAEPQEDTPKGEL
jgi:hypothetical protein